MKLGPVTKLRKRNMTTSKKKIYSDVILANCDVIDIFPIFGQFGSIRKPDFGCMDCKTYIFINSNLFFLERLKTELKSL